MWLVKIILRWIYSWFINQNLRSSSVSCSVITATLSRMYHVIRPNCAFIISSTVTQCLHSLIYLTLVERATSLYQMNTRQQVSHYTLDNAQTLKWDALCHWESAYPHKHPRQSSWALETPGFLAEVHFLVNWDVWASVQREMGFSHTDNPLSCKALAAERLGRCLPESGENKNRGEDKRWEGEKEK